MAADDEDRSEKPQGRDYVAEAKHAAKAGAKVEKAAETRYVRGGPDGPQEIKGMLGHTEGSSEEQTWTRGNDPEAAALALAAASVGTTGGPFAGSSYNHAAQALADPVSEEDRIAGQHRAHAAAHPEVTEEEAQAKAHEEAKAKAKAAAAAKGTKAEGDAGAAEQTEATAEKATKPTKGSKGSVEGGAKEAEDAPVGTGDTAPPAD